MTRDTPTDDVPTPTITRRTALKAGSAVAGATALSGCLGGLFETRSARSPPLVENRPKAVYVPTHVDGMGMAGTKQSGQYRAALTFAFPHRFWLITGQDRKKVPLDGDDDVHLMVSLMDQETGLSPPSGSVGIEMTKDGETVLSKSLWPMLSQRMGFHFGDNLSLDGEGTYDVTVSVGPVDARKTGSFRGKFGNPVETTFTFEFSRSKVENLSYQRLSDTKGQLGAVKPMQMDGTTVPRLPKKGSLPGQTVGEVRSGDARFVAQRLDQRPAGVEGSGPYLGVSARTPYNRYPVPFMAVSATVSRDESTVYDGALQSTMDSDLNFHYGAGVDSLQSGDVVELQFGAPPQVARHEGYETAFFEFENEEFTVP